jgi:formylglycine-generating enzyme required for sulfatase activity
MAGKQFYIRTFTFGVWCVFLALHVSAQEVTATTAPEGMIWIPSGEFEMGAVVNGDGSCEMTMPSNDAEPIHRVRVDGFWMDKTVVTNEQFAKFVAATGYITIKASPVPASTVNLFFANPSCYGVTTLYA